MPNALFLIGMPGCGKSTYTEQFTRKNSGYAIISSDNIIEEVAREKNCSYFEAIISMSKVETYEKLENMMITAVQRKQNIIIDRTNRTQYERYFTMKHLSDSYTRIGVIFNVCHDKILFRIRRREILTSKHIPDEVIERMLKNYEEPSGREFHKIENIYS